MVVCCVILFSSATGVSLNRRRAVDQRQQAGEEPGQLGPVCRAIYNVVDALQIVSISFS